MPPHPTTQNPKYIKSTKSEYCPNPRPPLHTPHTDSPSPTPIKNTPSYLITNSIHFLPTPTTIPSIIPPTDPPPNIPPIPPNRPEQTPHPPQPVVPPPPPPHFPSNALQISVTPLRPHKPNIHTPPHKSPPTNNPHF